MKTCPKCGFANQDDYKFCERCRHKFKKKRETKKDSPLSIVAAALSLFSCTYLLGALIAIVDLAKNDKTKRHLGSGFAIFCAVIYLFVGISDMRKNYSNASNTTTEIITEQSIDGITPSSYEEPTLDNFTYTVTENGKIILEKYSGKAKILKIKNKYNINGEPRKVDLLDLRLSGSKTTTIIFSKGIKEVNTAIFNMSDIQEVYFPKSMTCVYDYCLSYLHPEEGQKIKIHYAGTQEEWQEIFKEYKVKDFEESKDAAEAGKIAADKFNAIIGGYDPNDFSFYFESTYK